MNDLHAADVAAISRLDIVPTLLETVCRTTGMGFAAIARVTETHWIACGVRDEIGFGLEPGGELELETTLCHEIRQSRTAVVISDVDVDPVYADHHTPAIYGLKSYISIPIVLTDGRFFGTLCAIDPHPHDLMRPGIVDTFELFGRLIALQLDQADRFDAHRASAEAMRESEARHRQILDSATDHAIIATDIAGHITRWNVGAERIFGWSEAEMLDAPLDRFFTPEDLAAGQPAHEMRGALAHGHAADERWHLCKDGSRFWAQGEMTPLRRSDGEVVGFVKVLRDRTVERLRAQRLDLLARASAGLLSANDPEKVLYDILTSGAEVLGYDQSYSYIMNADCSRMRLLQSTGVPQGIRDWLADVPVGEVPLCGRVVEQRAPLVIADLQASPDPATALAKSHGVRAYAGFPILAGEKLHGVISFVSMSRDRFEEQALIFFESFARFLSIGHERLDREAALSELAMTLERRVDERTRELMASEEALRHSQKMDALGQLTGGVAHDFNNLLTIIRGSADLLLRGNLPDAKRERFTRAIGDTADRAAKLTSQLLSFARRQALAPERFDVGERLRSIADMLNSVTGGRVEIAMEVPDGPCIVHADASQFETALVNMAINARDAMDGVGTLTISLSCGHGIPSIRGHAASVRPFVGIALRDTGTGIGKADLQRVFEPFFTTKGIGKGTGLGLSQVFGFAKQSGGDIDVASMPGEGTTFTLYLPQADDAAVDSPIEIAPGTAPVQRGQRILVVEDNLEVGAFSSEALNEIGYETQLVSSAEEALDTLGAGGGDFDAVFSDVVMPGMGGLELAKRLRATMPHMPVILASGYSHVLAQEGAHGFHLLQKPYSTEQLGRALDRLILNAPAREG